MDPHMREDHWTTGPTWGDPPTYETVYSEISNDSLHPGTPDEPSTNSQGVFIGDCVIAFAIAVYALLVCLLLFSVGSQEEFALYRHMVFFFSFVLFVAMFRIVAWMMGFLIGGWLKACTGGFDFGREVELRRNEGDEWNERW